MAVISMSDDFYKRASSLYVAIRLKMIKRAFQLNGHDQGMKLLEKYLQEVLKEAQKNER
jgi:hypothetical protein